MLGALISSREAIWGFFQGAGASGAARAWLVGPKSSSTWKQNPTPIFKGVGHWACRSSCSHAWQETGLKQPETSPVAPAGGQWTCHT